MIIKTIDLYDFRRAFADYDRTNNFSYEGLEALFEWLDELSAFGCLDESSAGTVTPYELDVIGLCCEFTEYSDLGEIQETYSSTDIDSIEDLRDYTSVIEFDGGIIIHNF